MLIQTLDANSIVGFCMQEFKALFCQHFNCPASSYEDRAFKELLYRHARPVALCLRRIRPSFFDEDFKFIRYLAEVTDLREARATAADFQDANAAKRSFWRTRFRLRVSGLKASRLAERLFS
jgi:hypothetical protein